jgi:tRNA threonylcarbamoyladenosine biosynthesis protein TsaE
MAAALAGLCVPGDVVLLGGDLGAGKTTFAQGFGRALGITEPITSPTFTLVRQYPVGDQPVRPGVEPLRTLIHADVYRLGSLGEIVDLGLGELVEDAAVALVEWGDMASPVLGDGSLTVWLAPGPALPVGGAQGGEDADPDHRSITLGSTSPTWASRWARLSESLHPWAAERAVG